MNKTNWYCFFGLIVGFGMKKLFFVRVELVCFVWSFVRVCFSQVDRNSEVFRYGHSMSSIQPECFSMTIESFVENRFSSVYAGRIILSHASLSRLNSCVQCLTTRLWVSSLYYSKQFDSWIFRELFFGKYRVVLPRLFVFTIGYKFVVFFRVRF